MPDYSADAMAAQYAELPRWRAGTSGSPDSAIAAARAATDGFFAAGVIPVVLTRWEMTGTREEVPSGVSQ